MSSPLIYLIQNLSTHPTFPMVLAVLQAKELAPDTGDAYDDGLSLFNHILNSDQLDELGQSITIEMCGGLLVPVLHLRDRDYAVKFRSVFPAEDGPAKGRLCVRDNVERKTYPDAVSYFARFFDHPDFDHAFALENRRMSRDRETRKWVPHEDTDDFADAVEILDDCDESLEPIAE